MRPSAARAVLLAGILIASTAMLWPATPARADTGGTVYIRTVPAVAGVALAVGTARVTTDAQGAASARVGNLNGIANAMAVIDPVVGDARIALHVVVPLPHTAPHVSHLQLGLDVTRLVQIHLDPGATGIPVADVSSLRLRSMVGEVLTIDPRTTGQVALLARRPQLVHGALTAQTVTWSVERIAAGPGVAVSSAAPRFDPSSAAFWTLRLAPVSGTVHITTVPPLPGTTFLLEGASIVTGPGGTATADVSDLNNIAGRLTLSTSTVGDLDVSIRKVTKAASHVAGQRAVMAGLIVRRAVTLRFTDAAGQAVPSSHITRAVFAANGTTITTSGSAVEDPVPLLVAEASLVRGAWRSRPVAYTLSSVTVDGSAAVFTGRQHFEPSSSSTWTIRLSIFHVTVTAHDALFGTRVGSHVVVRRPDGTTYPHRVSGSGAPTPLLPAVRGDYALHFTGAAVAGTNEVRISRNDSIDVRLVTPLDVAVVGLVIALVAGSTVYGGRRLLRRQRQEA